jgi:predicted transcriptional regulator
MAKESQVDAVAETVEAKGEKPLLKSVVRIVDAYIRGNQIPSTEVPGLIHNVHSVLSDLASGRPATETPKPPVSIKKSIGDDFIICLEDGKKLTMLKRYLRAQYDMSPEDYRKKWDLPPDYPMVAPAYARLRSTFAKKIGLGRIPTGRVGAGRSRRKA